MKTDFEKFALSQGIGSARLDQYGRIMDPQFDYISPMITEERKLNVAQMDVFSRIMVDRIIFLGTSITSDVANIICAQLLYLDSVSNEDINLYINSPGGSINAGLGIYDIMNCVKSDVSTTAVCLAASMGSVLLSAGTHGKRNALEHAEIMLHQASGGCEGKNVDIQIAAKHIQTLQDELYNILARNCNKTFDEISNAANNGDNWLFAKEAKEFGLIDKVITKKNNK